MKLIVYVLSALLLFSSVSSHDTTSQIDLSQLDNDITDALNAGINWIFQKAADKYDISCSDVQVTAVNSIEKSVSNGATYYTFDVDATNNDDANIQATYTVKCSGSGDMLVTKWNYRLERINNEGNSDDNQDDDNNTEVEVETVVETETNEEGCEESDVEPTEEDCVEVEVVTEDSEESNVEPTEENSVEVEVEAEEEEDNQCNPVDASELDNDDNLRDALNYGISWIFEKAAEEYDVSASDIEVTQVNSICSWEDDGDTYYTFDVNATNNNDATVESTFTVRLYSRSGDFKVVNKWRYEIDCQPKSDETGSDDNNDDDNQGTDNDEGDSDDVEVEDTEHCEELDVEDDEGNCEEDNVESDEEEVSVEENDNGCQSVDQSELDGDDNLRNALNEGIAWIFERAHNKYGISNEEVSVSQINSICSYEENGNTYYAFDVVGTNGDNDNVDATFTVKYVSNSGDFRVVNEWQYNIHYSEDDNGNDDNNEDQDNGDEDNDNDNEGCEEEDSSPQENEEECDVDEDQ